VCRLDHPICSIQNPNFVCIRFIFWAKSVCCLLVHLFLLVLRFACRFKFVLGTARTTQIGGGVTVAKAQRSPCGVVSDSTTSILLKLSYPPLLSKDPEQTPAGSIRSHIKTKISRTTLLRFVYLLRRCSFFFPSASVEPCFECSGLRPEGFGEHRGSTSDEGCGDAAAGECGDGSDERVGQPWRLRQQRLRRRGNR
jgi:hypothetical protein